MEVAMIYLLCPDDDIPWGGIRKMYRHVDILQQHGMPAAILHKQPGFRCTWFANRTPIAYISQTQVKESDYMVMPEILGPIVTTTFPGVRKVVFNQNCYSSFRGFRLHYDERLMPYTHPDVIAALVVSRDSEEYMRYVFPRLPVYRLRYAIDPELFAPGKEKKDHIAFMPRKQGEDILQVLNILRFRGALKGFTLVPIHQKTAAETAAILRAARVFLSFGHPEGFGLPAAEAMACGCVTVGYHGGGGREFLRPDVGFPIEVGDILGFARTVESVLHQCRNAPEALEALTQRAAAFIRETYSPANEANDIHAAWQSIQGLASSPVRRTSF
jgi:hypothetical protein